MWYPNPNKLKSSDSNKFTPDSLPNDEQSFDPDTCLQCHQTICHQTTWPTPKFNVAVMGSGPCGKTSLIRRYIEDSFDQTFNYVPTVEGVYEKQIRTDITLEIFDTSGCDNFEALWEYYIEAVSGFILVYAVDDRASFTNVKHLHNLIAKIKGTSDIPMVMVGTKIDNISGRAVTLHQARKLASELGGVIECFEVSAANGQGVKEVFDTIANKTRRKLEDHECKRTNHEGGLRLMQVVHESITARLCPKNPSRRVGYIPNSMTPSSPPIVSTTTTSTSPTFTPISSGSLSPALFCPRTCRRSRSVDCIELSTVKVNCDRSKKRTWGSKLFGKGRARAATTGALIPFLQQNTSKQKIPPHDTRSFFSSGQGEVERTSTSISDQRSSTTSSTGSVNIKAVNKKERMKVTDKFRHVDQNVCLTVAPRQKYFSFKNTLEKIASMSHSLEEFKVQGTGS